MKLFEVLRNMYNNDDMFRAVRYYYKKYFSMTSLLEDQNVPSYTSTKKILKHLLFTNSLDTRNYMEATFLYMLGIISIISIPFKINVMILAYASIIWMRILINSIHVNPTKKYNISGITVDEFQSCYTDLTDERIINTLRDFCLREGLSETLYIDRYKKIKSLANKSLGN